MKTIFLSNKLFSNDKVTSKQREAVNWQLLYISVFICIHAIWKIVRIKSKMKSKVVFIVKENYHYYYYYYHRFFFFNSLTTLLCSSLSSFSLLNPSYLILYQTYKQHYHPLFTGLNAKIFLKKKYKFHTMVSFIIIYTKTSRHLVHYHSQLDYHHLLNLECSDVQKFLLTGVNTNKLLCTVYLNVLYKQAGFGKLIAVHVGVLYIQLFLVQQVSRLISKHVLF